MRSLKILLLIVSIAALSACQKKQPDTQLPDSWIVNPGDTTEESEIFEDLSPDAENALGKLFHVPTAALETGAKPSDKTPWHMEYFITDLAVSVGGWVGALVSKGTPSVQLAWRRQYPAPVSVPSLSEEPGLQITTEATRGELRHQLEPFVAASVASGRVKNVEKLRENLLNAAVEFQTLASGLEQAPRGPWWVSRFRVDLGIDVSGKVGPAVEVGGDLRLRLEWFRIERKLSTTAPKLAAAEHSLLAQRLLVFSNAVAEDLTAIAVGPSRLSKKGFEVAGYRLAVGMTYKTAEIGIATAKTSVVGHLFFSRDIKKPVVHPAPQKEGFLALMGEASGRPKAMPITRKQFRKGLRKALKMGNSLSRIASVAPGKQWKVYEMRTGLDLGLSGKTGLAKVTGVATAELVFLNQNF